MIEHFFFLIHFTYCAIVKTNSLLFIGLAVLLLYFNFYGAVVALEKRIF